MIKKFICAAALTVSVNLCAFAQTASPTPQPSPSQMETTISQPGQTGLPRQPSPTLPLVTLATILDEAEKQVAVYQETFKDLLAIETKTFEEYDKNGELEDEAVVESNFFVYQPARDAQQTTELRNVIKVDGKLIPNSQERADRFLTELPKAKTVEKELKEIEEEGLRYDKTYGISGLTLFEAIVLANNLRPVFDFKLLGEENFQGRKVYIVGYQQTKKSPFIAINEKESKERGVKTTTEISVPGALKKSDKFLRGKLWIDAQNFQVWREERQVTLQIAEPIVAQETIFEYAPSEFEILVPKKITFRDNRIKKISKSDEYGAVKKAVVVFDYSKFRKTNVDVKIIDEP